MPPTSALNTSYTHVSVPSSETNVWNPRHGGGGGAKHFPNKTCIFENRKSVEIKFGIVKTKRHPTQNSIATMLEFEKLIKVFCVWIFRSLLDWQIAPTRCDLTCDALHMAEGGVRSTPHLKTRKYSKSQTLIRTVNHQPWFPCERLVDTNPDRRTKPKEIKLNYATTIVPTNADIWSHHQTPNQTENMHSIENPKYWPNFDEKPRFEIQTRVFGWMEATIMPN